MQVEEPFGLLALEHGCKVVEDRIRLMEEEHDTIIEAVQRIKTQPAPPPGALSAAAAAAAGAGGVPGDESSGTGEAAHSAGARHAMALKQ